MDDEAFQNWQWFLFRDPVPWMSDGACAGSGFQFVPDEETDSGLMVAQGWCNRCPVRARCLAWAMLHGAEGYWGGTSTYQRAQLRRVRTRAKCPLCLGTVLVYSDPHELCLACGVSWVRDVRKEPIGATPLPAARAS